MEEYQKRVLKEKQDLDEKIDRLSSFISSDTFRAVELGEQKLLLRQQRIMELYSEVLEDRYSVFLHFASKSDRA